MKDKLDAPLAFGDEVFCMIPPHEGHFGFVIGEMSYSTGEVTCIASDIYSGMPVNTAWVTRTGSRNVETATRLRERYQTFRADAFKPLIQP